MPEALQQKGVVATFGPPLASALARATWLGVKVEYSMLKQGVDIARNVGNIAIDSAIHTARQPFRVDDHDEL